jgi:MerR family transcriptional regulator, light-induced transcriptional regulator
MSSTEPISLLSRRYLDALLIPNRLLALEAVTHSLGSGTPALDLYVEVIAWAQHEIGRLWERNEVSVSQEHVATAISQLTLSQIYPALPRKNQNGRTALVSCVEGELHELGARMIADMLEVEGYEVLLLGANTPTQSLVQMVGDLSPDIVGLSVSMESFLPSAIEAVEQIRAIGSDSPEILVGGHAVEGLEAHFDNVRIVVDAEDVRNVISELVR